MPERPKNPNINADPPRFDELDQITAQGDNTVLRLVNGLVSNNAPFSGVHSLLQYYRFFMAKNGINIGQNTTAEFVRLVPNWEQLFGEITTVADGQLRNHI